MVVDTRSFRGGGVSSGATGGVSLKCTEPGWANDRGGHFGAITPEATADMFSSVGDKMDAN